MATGAAGTFLISWAQAELDGLVGTDPAAIAVGSTWRWCGIWVGELLKKQLAGR